MRPYPIAKLDEDRRLAFGYANVAVRVDGEPLVDLHGEVVDVHSLEDCAYDYVVAHGGANVSHQGPVVARVVESAMLTAEKVRAMFSDGHGNLTISDEAFAEVEKVMAGRWWIGFRVHDPATWNRVKRGELKMFSIEGVGEREEL
jgi:hypothetical protein